MKVYKFEVIVIDHENQGEECIRNEVSRSKYYNITVMNSASAEIGEWSDDHPLNSHTSYQAEYARLFPKT